MNLITTTQLRTKTSDLVAKLLSGEEVGLIHRSKIIATLIPEDVKKKKVINPKRLAATLKQFEPNKKMTIKQLMKNYEHYMMYRHGPNIS